MNPIISIIIPCFNHGKYLQNALDSINLEKNNYNVEVIVVNDGSTDESTVKILKDLEKKGCQIINQINGGLGNARNNGIKLAKGKYILPLDSDNKVLNPYLNKAIDILEQNEFLDIVYGNAIYFGEKTGKWVVGDYSLLKLITGNYIDACAVYRKSVWEKIGGYDEEMPVMGVEDWDFWLNCSFNGFRFYYLNEDCFEYRVLSNSMINSMSNTDANKVVKYVESKYHQIVFTDKLESFFFKRFNEKTEQIAKYISFKNLVIAIFLKFKSKLFSK
jgi:glycosyltransferase involved in cell wall biosynthesis